MAADLVSHSSAIPFYSAIYIIFGLPKRQDLISASANLIGLSNDMATPDYGIRSQQQDEIEKLLKIMRPL